MVHTCVVKHQSKAKGANIVPPLICLVWFSLIAAAQEPPYSADSLMAAFKKGSQTSLKGTQITFTGVIAEFKKSSVIFKSSGNDKVICELVSPIDIGNTGLVGSQLTVVGKVRGRGILGNVTLDQCNLPLSETISKQPAPAEASLERSEQPTERSEEPTERAKEPIGHYAETETKEIEGRAPVVANVVPTTRSSPPRLVLETRTVGNAVTGLDQPIQPTTEREQPNEVIKEGSDKEASNSTNTDFGRVLRGSITVLIGIGALLAFAKLCSAIASRLRTSRLPSTNERRAALEALLAAEKKKK